MRRAGASITIRMICGIAALLAANRTAFAQAGSAGGTLGKTDKSAGGSRATAEPAKPPGGVSQAANVSVAGRWKWTADCASGHWTGGFQLTQGMSGEFNGAYLGLAYGDLGSITDGHVSGGTITFLRHAIITQNWTGRLSDGGKRINGDITGNEHCTWEGVRD
jgi:hypothetical protein